MVCDHFLSAVLADRQAEAHTADKKQALDCLPPTLLNHLLNLGYEPEHYLDMLENVETIKSDIEITKQNIAEDYADTMSLAVFLISLAVSVYFAEPIRAVIPINLLLLLILVHIVYVLIRWYVKGCMRSRGYY